MVGFCLPADVPVNEAGQRLEEFAIMAQTTWEFPVPENRIHPTAYVHPDACLGHNVHVGAFSQVHAGVHLGDNTRVESYCELGYSNGLEKQPVLEIGANSLIRSHSIFYLGSRFEAGLQTGHRVTVRENTQAGENLHLGTLCDIQGDCQFGHFCRLHSRVFVAQLSQLEDFAWLFPSVILTNDPSPPSNALKGVTIKAYAAVAAAAVILPGIIVGEHALVGAGSVVNRDVPSHTLVAGNPARVIRPVEEIRHRETGQPMYPWPRQFQRGYPAKITRQWAKEFPPEEEGG